MAFVVTGSIIGGIGTVGAAIGSGLATVGSAVATGVGAVGSAIGTGVGAIGTSIGNVGSLTKIGTGITKAGSYLSKGASFVGNVPGYVSQGLTAVKGTTIGKSFSSLYSKGKSIYDGIKGSETYQSFKKAYDTIGKVKTGANALMGVFGGGEAMIQAGAGQQANTSFNNMMTAQAKANDWNITLLNNLAEANYTAGKDNIFLQADQLRRFTKTQDLISGNTGADATTGTNLFNKISSVEAGTTMINRAISQNVNQLQRTQDAIFLQQLEGDASLQRLAELQKASRADSLQGIAKGLGKSSANGTLDSLLSKGADWLFGGDTENSFNITESSLLSSVSSDIDEYNIIRDQLPGLDMPDLNLTPVFTGDINTGGSNYA